MKFDQTTKNNSFDRIGQWIKTVLFIRKHGLGDGVGLSLFADCVEAFLQEEDTVDFLGAIV